MRTIDELLRADAAQVIPDNGFSERVMAGLPAARPRQHAWWRPALVMGSALLGSVLAVVLSPAIESPMAAMRDILAYGVLSKACYTALAIGGVLLASALVVAFDPD